MRLRAGNPRGRGSDDVAFIFVSTGFLGIKYEGVKFLRLWTAKSEKEGDGDKCRANFREKLPVAGIESDAGSGFCGGDFNFTRENAF